MILGMLRVKNEGRWIHRCLSSLMPVCHRIILMDDHSTDDTVSIASTIPKVECFESPFQGLDEARDKNHLLAYVENRFKPEWIIAIDGDEMLSPKSQDQLPAIMRTSRIPCLSMRIWYLWDREDQVRVDGVYGDYHRESIFRPNGTRFPALGNGSGNFHCGNVPRPLRQHRQVLKLDLLHFGYLHREDRIRKYEWYRQTDPDNRIEDGYRHMVIGDLYNKDEKFRHGGPRKLQPLP